MYKLKRSYGKKAFDEWYARTPRDLGPDQTNPDAANSEVWSVSSFRQLIEAVAFLGSMNKRLALYYRGQIDDLKPAPALFRNAWPGFDTDKVFQITPANRQQFFGALVDMGRCVFEICNERGLGLPRWRGLRDIREVQWAVVQHYGLWPTPLLDVSSNLRVAASLAMNFVPASRLSPKTGYLYVAGMPHSTGSISYNIDQHIVLARLQSACPPVAKRPHYQDGFLVGRFPLYEADEATAEKSSLLLRLVAKFKLQDFGDFWDADFPPICKAALLPSQDPLLDHFSAEFGTTGRHSVRRLAQLITARG